MRRPVSPPSAADPVTVRIERIGAEGDGIATRPDGERIYVPLTLPGELVRVGPADGPHALEVLEPGPDRIAPPCPHFGTCGGCTLQHWRDDAYAAWKTDLLRDALRRAGYDDAPIAPMARSAPAQRRRMDFAVRRMPRGVALGLQARGSHAVVDLHACFVLHPALAGLLDPLRALLPRLHGLRREASVIANLLDRGADVLLRTDAALDRSDREHLIGFAREHCLVRLCHATGKAEPEPIVVMQPPRITLSGVAVDVPPGGFLQATAGGESAIVQAVLAGLPPKLPARARVAELYAGSGSLTFALVQLVPVTAWEGDSAAAAALRQAANRAGLAGRIVVTQRDLARQPIAATELAGFAAMVLDPPFVGAAPQMGPIAASKIARVVYVSCNPAVLARDARVLRDAGYRLVSALPVDQFLWSARLESVCVFAL